MSTRLLVSALDKNIKILGYVVTMLLTSEVVYVIQTLAQLLSKKLLVN